MAIDNQNIELINFITSKKPDPSITNKSLSSHDTHTVLQDSDYKLIGESEAPYYEQIN